VRLAFHNQTGSPGARTTSTTADLSGVTVLQGLLTDLKFNVIPQPGVVARLGYSRGAWISQVVPGT
jgi:hypothetical protein